mgnify:FL=1
MPSPSSQAPLVADAAGSCRFKPLPPTRASTFWSHPRHEYQAYTRFRVGQMYAGRFIGGLGVGAMSSALALVSWAFKR